MKQHAADRIKDLQSRGYKNAGLYDPPGVGGTHVMYVLHHADKPEIYADLPNNPRISPVVELWKGLTKYAGLAAMGAFAAIGVLHYMVSGPNRVQPQGRGRRQAPHRRSLTMAAYDVEQGDAVHPGDPVVVDRYTPGARVNHWITATCLVLLALSGLALFYPGLLFPHRPVRRRPVDAGDPSLDRRRAVLQLLRPVFAVLAGQSVAGAKTAPGWRACATCLPGNEESLPEVGKYNAGQKAVFWLMSILILVLICTGIVIWDQYFYPLTTIAQKRIAMLVHSLAAVTIICVWIVHVYAAIWVRGTIGAMTRGQVTGGWAWRHHRKWLKELVTGKSGDRETGAKPAS